MLIDAGFWPQFIPDSIRGQNDGTACKAQLSTPLGVLDNGFDDFRPRPAMRAVVSHAVDDHQFGARYCRSRIPAAFNVYQGVIGTMYYQRGRGE